MATDTPASRSSKSPLKKRVRHLQASEIRPVFADSSGPAPFFQRAASNRRRIWICSLLLLLVLIWLVPVRGAEITPKASVRTIPVATPLLADGWNWRTLFNPIQSALGNRRRMIQFATIGMCLGLYILMRK
jgi:hypothetical protein